MQPPLLLAVVLILAIQLIAWAGATADKLEEAIGKEKIFAADAKLKVGVEGSEATVNTFKVEAVTDDDCKIDAVLVGKIVFASDTSLSRVTVRFYDRRNPNEYLEVKVTVGDVKAFATHTISKEQLLSALDITKHSEQLSTSKPVSSSTQSTASTQSAASTQGTASTQSTASTQGTTSTQATANAPDTNRGPTPGTASYKGYGLVLNYPTSWKIDYPKSGNTLARFYLRGSSLQLSTVELKLYSAAQATPGSVTAQAPETLFRELLRVAWKQSLGDLIGGDLPFLPEHHHGEDYEGHNRRHGGNQLSVTGVQIPSSLKLGQSKTISGVQRAYWASPMMSAREYMRTVSFASHEYVFQLLLVCTEKDASAANASFEQLLSELKLASSAKSGSAPKKKN